MYYHTRAFSVLEVSVGCPKCSKYEINVEIGISNVGRYFRSMKKYVWVGTNQVISDTLHENILAQVFGHHSNDTRSLHVRNGIEDLVDFIRSLNWHFDRMTAAQRVQAKGTLKTVCDIALPYFPLWVEDIAGIPGHP